MSGHNELYITTVSAILKIVVLSFLQGKAFGSGSLLNTSIIKIGSQIYSGVKKNRTYLVITSEELK